jgi:hypothetical protein
MAAERPPVRALNNHGSQTGYDGSGIIFSVTNVYSNSVSKRLRLCWTRTYLR